MAKYGSLCRNIENEKENNPQIGHVEETVGVKLYVSKVFKYTLDLFYITTYDYQSVSIACLARHYMSFLILADIV